MDEYFQIKSLHSCTVSHKLIYVFLFPCRQNCVEFYPVFLIALWMAGWYFNQGNHRIYSSNPGCGASKTIKKQVDDHAATDPGNYFKQMS